MLTSIRVQLVGDFFANDPSKLKPILLAYFSDRADLIRLAVVDHHLLRGHVPAQECLSMRAVTFTNIHFR